MTADFSAPADPARLPPVADAPGPTRRPRTAASRGLALALTATRLMTGATLLAAGATLAAPALAQPAAEARRFEIPAGPLEDALNRFGREAGILLSFDPERVRGLASPGLAGQYGVREGLQRLLDGHELDVIGDPDGSYRLQPRPRPLGSSGRPETGTVLPEVRVVGITEGSDSYTTTLTNTATKLDLSLRETPQSVTVMTHRRIQDQGLGEISSVLDQTTGLYFHNTNNLGADSNFIYSRGFALDNYQVDGVPRSTRFGFKNDIADTALFDRVEVVRGASGLLNGVGEPSGAVNMVRKLPTRDFQASVAGQYGSWNTRRAEIDVAGPLSADGRLRGRFVAVQQNGDSAIRRARQAKSILYGIVEANLTASTVVSAGIEYQNHRGYGAGGARSGAPIYFADGTRTGFGRDSNLAANWSQTHRRNFTAFASLEHFFDNQWRVKVDLEQSRRRYDMTLAGLNFNIFPDGTGNISGVRWVGEPEQNSVGLHAVGPFQWFGRTHELVVGTSAYRMKEYGPNHTGFNHEIDNIFDFIATGDYPIQPMAPDGASSLNRDTQSGFYLATRLKPTDELSLILGGRITNWRTRTDRTSTAGVQTRGTERKESGVVTPYAGIVYDLTPQWSVYGSYTDIFRPATVYDVNGDLLDPAEGLNLEAGVKFAFFENRLNLSLAVFRTKKDNVPEYVPGPGGATSYGPTGQYIYKGVDGTRTTGFEVEVAGQLTPAWQISGGYSHSRPKDAEGDPRLTYIPTRQLKVFSAYRLPWADGALTLGGNVRWQNGAWYEEARQGGLTLVDLMGQYRITPKLTATLNVNNVFDKSYYTDIQIAGWYGLRRNAFLNLRYAF